MKGFFESIIAYEQDLNMLTIAFRVVLASFFGGVIGIERGRHGSQAGMRTHIFVCLGGALTSLLSVYCIEVLGYASDPLRVSAQVVSGIGFLGAGMIIVKSEKMITGLTTAAIMWTTAIIGIAVGVGFYVAALFAVLICAFTATVLNRIEHKRKTSTTVYLEINDLSLLPLITENIKSKLPSDAHLEVVSPKSGTVGSLGIAIISTELDSPEDFKTGVASLDGVRFIVVE